MPCFNIDIYTYNLYRGLGKEVVGAHQSLIDPCKKRKAPQLSSWGLCPSPIPHKLSSRMPPPASLAEPSIPRSSLLVWGLRRRIQIHTEGKRVQVFSTGSIQSRWIAELYRARRLVERVRRRGLSNLERGLCPG